MNSNRISPAQIAKVLSEVGASIVQQQTPQKNGEMSGHKYIVIDQNCDKIEARFKKNSRGAASFKQISEQVKIALKSKEIQTADKLKMLQGYQKITEKYESKISGVFSYIIAYLFGQLKEVKKAEEIIQKGLDEYKPSDGKGELINPSELKYEAVFKILGREEKIAKDMKTHEEVFKECLLSNKEAMTELDKAIYIRRSAQAGLTQSATGEVTQENLAEHMQQVISNYYGKPFPHRDDIIVEHEGQQVRWNTLTPQQKFDVVYEHSLPHNRPKLKKLDYFYGNEKSWVQHIEGRLFRGSHNLDGTPRIIFGMEKDSRQDHGSDHGTRVGLFSAIYAALYDKYDPTVNLTPEDMIAIQLAGAFHDSGRQTEGVDVDDLKSAENAAINFEQWGFSPTYIQEARSAISGKDDQKLQTKSCIAKSIQCADSKEYERVGIFDSKYLDIYKEFNGFQAEGNWTQAIEKKPLKEGRTLEEFNQELVAVNHEMANLMFATSGNESRKKFSANGKNYYTEILNRINPQDHPKMYAILTEWGIIRGVESPVMASVTTQQIDAAGLGATQHPPVIFPQLERTGELFPGMLSDVKFVANLGGTTGAQKVQDSTKGTVYAKKTTGGMISPQHLKSEYYTNKAYRALGVKVPDVALYHAVSSSTLSSQRVTEGEEGGVEQPVMLSRFVPEGTQDLDQYLQTLGLNTKNYCMQGVMIPADWKIHHATVVKEIQDAAKKSFVADSLLANWDVAGLEFDNMRYDPVKKEIWRIDNGAGLDFRAQGGKKSPLAFTAVIQEFETLRNPGINLNTTFLFATLTNDEIIEQIDAILPRREAFLATIPDHLKEIMSQRFDYLTVYKSKLQNLPSVGATINRNDDNLPLEDLPSVDAALHPNDDGLPLEVKVFIKAAADDIINLSFDELQAGFEASLMVIKGITNPEDQTTLWTVAERIAQAHLKANRFEKALEVRMLAAEALNPAPPLADLPITLQGTQSKLGLKLYPVDTSLFKNHSLAVQKRRYTDGSTQIHFDAKLSHPARQNLKDSVDQIKMNPEMLFNALPEGFCRSVKVSNETLAYEGRKHKPKDSSPSSSNSQNWEGDFSHDIVKDGYRVSLYPSYAKSNVIEFEGVGKVSIGNEGRMIISENNRITIDLDPHVSQEEAAGKLSIIFAALGLGAVSSSSRKEDIERIKIMQLFRGFYPAEAYAFERAAETFEESVESLKQRIGEKVNDMKNKFQLYLVDQPELMYEQEIYPGQSVWAIKGLAQEVKEVGGIGLMAGLTAFDFSAATSRLISILKSGALSSQDRFQLGIIAAGASTASDLVSGGGESVFVRMVTQGMSMDLRSFPLAGKMQILYDLDLVERVGYGYRFDMFGSKEGPEYQFRSNIQDLTKDIKDFGSNKNEICVHHRIGPEFIKGVRVNSEPEKEALIAAITEEGFLDQGRINGIPIDQFIHVGDVKPEYWA